MTGRPPLPRSVVVLLPALLAVAAYLALRTTSFDLVNYDDDVVVLGNPVAARGAGAAFTERMGHAWLPLYALSLGADRALFGLDPAGFHLHSVLLHGLDAALLAALVLLLTRRSGAALAAGALFALHPAVSESVAWVASRKDLLSFALAALSGIAYLRAEGPPRRPGLHAAGAALLGLAMLAKAGVVVLPALLVLAVLAGATRGASRRGALLATLPYAAVAAGLTVVHLAVARLEGVAGAPGGESAGAVVLGAATALARYVRLLAVPWGLSVEHGIVPGWAGAETAAGLLLLAAVPAAAILLARAGRPGLAAALAGTFVALAPFNGVFPRTSVLFAERYLYVAAAVAAGLAGWLLPGRAVAPISAALLALLAVRLPAWKDSRSLWEDAVRRAPGSALAHAKLGEALLDEALRARDPAEGRRLFDLAAGSQGAAAERARTPLERARALHDAGVARLGAGRFEEARAVLEGAAALVPALGDAASADFRASLAVNRAKALEGLGREPEAREALEALLSADPGSVAAWLNLGILRAHAGLLPEAREALARAEALDPGLPQLRLARVDLELLGGDFPAARAAVEGAVAAFPGDPAVLSRAGEVLALLGRPRQAEERFRAALAAAPGYAAARRGLAGLSLGRSRGALGSGSKGAVAEAAKGAREAIRLDPAGAEPRFALGDALAAGGDAEGALAAYGEAADRGGGARARDLRAAVLLRLASAARAGGKTEAARGLVERALAERPGEVRLGRDLPRIAEGFSRIPTPPAGGEARGPLLDGFLALAAGDLGAAVASLSNATGESRAGGGASLLPATLVLRSRARLLAGESEGAVADLRELASLLPADGSVRFLLGAALATRAAELRARGEAAGGDAAAAAAREAYEEARRLDPARTEADLGLAELAVAEGRTVDAIRALNAVLARDPGRVEPHLVLASVYRAQAGDSGERTFLEEADRCYRRALAAAPDDARALCGRAEVAALTGKAFEAISFVGRALAADPDDPGARRLAGLLFARSARSQAEAGHADAALEMAERSLALGGITAAACLAKAHALRLKKDWAGAGAEIERARSLAPGDPDVRDAVASYYRDVGYALLLQGGRRAEADEAFRRALAADPPRVDLSGVRRLLEREPPAPEPAGTLPGPEAAAARARLVEEARRKVEEGAELLKAGKREEAGEAFRASLRSFENAEARFGLGVVLAASGDTAGAEEAYRRATADSPSHADAWLNLGALLYRKGDDRGAERAYAAWVLVAPADADPETRRKVEALLEVLRKRLRDAGAAGDPPPAKEGPR